MVTAGSYEVDVLEDKWTAVTRDRRLAAHFEHSVAIRRTAPDPEHFGPRPEPDDNWLIDRAGKMDKGSVPAANER